MGGGGKQTVTQNSKSEPWGPAQANISQGLGQLEGWWNTDRTPYSGPTVAPQSPETLLGNQFALSRAQTGSQYTNAGGSELNKTASGYYMDPANNPALMQKFNMGVESVMPSIDTQASNFGRYGSDTHNLLRGKALAGIANDIYAPERQLQMNTMQQAIPYASNDYRDLALLAGTGADQRQTTQNQLTANKTAWDTAQQQPLNDLNFYLNNALGAGTLGGVQTSQQPVYGPSNLATALGAGSSLASLGLLGYGLLGNQGGGYNMIPNQGLYGSSSPYSTGAYPYYLGGS